MLDLEKDVITFLLNDDDEQIAILRAQYEASSVSSRVLTGTGFFLYFSVPADVQKLHTPQTVAFGDVIGTIPGLKFGAGFLLHIKNGILYMLEGYSYEEPWPTLINEFSLSKNTKLTEKKFEALKKKDRAE